jgi:hypothetical protein
MEIFNMNRSRCLLLLVFLAIFSSVFTAENDIRGNWIGSVGRSEAFLQITTNHWAISIPSLNRVNSGEVERDEGEARFSLDGASYAIATLLDNNTIALHILPGSRNPGNFRFNRFATYTLPVTDVVEPEIDEDEYTAIEHPEEIIEECEAEEAYEETIEECETEEVCEEIIEECETEEVCDETIEEIVTEEVCEETIEESITEEACDETIEEIVTEETYDETIEESVTKEAYEETIEESETEEAYDETIEESITEEVNDEI